jgi:hypothetical protein
LQAAHGVNPIIFPKILFAVILDSNHETKSKTAYNILWSIYKHSMMIHAAIYPWSASRSRGIMWGKRDPFLRKLRDLDRSSTRRILGCVPVHGSDSSRKAFAHYAINESNHNKLERVKGIEPSYSAWKAAALPLSYTREIGPGPPVVAAPSHAWRSTPANL